MLDDFRTRVLRPIVYRASRAHILKLALLSASNVMQDAFLTQKACPPVQTVKLENFKTKLGARNVSTVLLARQNQVLASILARIATRAAILVMLLSSLLVLRAKLAGFRMKLEKPRVQVVLLENFPTQLEVWNAPCVMSASFRTTVAKALA